MPTLIKVEKFALGLPETQRAALAAQLLKSLPPVLHDEDKGIAEALRRDADFDADPNFGTSLEELDEQIKLLRGETGKPHAPSATSKS